MEYLILLYTGFLAKFFRFLLFFSVNQLACIREWYDNKKVMNDPIDIAILYAVDDRVFLKNLKMLSGLLGKQPELRYLVTVYYDASIDFIQLSKQFVNIRFHRFYSHKGVERSILLNSHGQALLFFEKHVLINPRDIAILASAVIKKPLLAAFLSMKNYRPLFDNYHSKAPATKILSQSLKNSLILLPYAFKKERYKFYALLNANWQITCYDAIAIDRKRMSHLLSTLPMSGRINLRSKVLQQNTGLYNIDYSLSLLLQESNEQVEHLGASGSIKYLHPTRYLFHGFFSSYSQLKKMIMLTLRYKKTAQPFGSIRFTTAAFQITFVVALLLLLKSTTAATILLVVAILMISRQLFASLNWRHPFVSIQTICMRLLAILLA